MFQSNFHLSWVIAVGLAVALTGCGARSSDEKQKPAQATENEGQERLAGQTETASQAGHEGYEHLASHGKNTEYGDQNNISSPETAKGLAELSDADAALAKKQRICPVSGDVLGTMGKPYKVTIKGKTIFLCCPGCEEELRKNPEKYLSKM